MAISSLTTAGVIPQPTMGRRLRRPQHTFQLRTRPYQVQPFMIAPVLPGETLKNLLLQATCISDPVKNRLIGWWKEYAFFYVRISDLDARDEYMQMVLDGTWTPTAVQQDTAEVNMYFTAAAGKERINWLKQCLKRIVETYYRDEGEAWDVATLASVAGGLALPLARTDGARGFWQSASNEADVTFRDVSISTAGDDAFTMGEFDDARRTFELLRQGFAEDMSYEDYLRSFGIRPGAAAKAEDPHMPELIRHIRQWAKPVSAIDPTDGSAASALVWNTTERADKDRFFKEPGFLVGVTVARPKVYWSRQTSYGAVLMDDVYSWLPALMSDDPNTSLKLVPDGFAPIGDVADAGGVWIDVKDLLLYGDQFLNFALTDTEAGLVALPTAALGKRYAAEAEIDALFASASPANQLREDGIVSLNIAGRQVDTSR